MTSYTILTPSLSRGGAEGMAYLYGRYLLAQGHDVEFYLLEDRVDKKYSNVRYHVIGNNRGNFNFMANVFSLLRRSFEHNRTYISVIPHMTLLVWLSSCIRGKKLDVIYTIHNNLDFDLRSSFYDYFVRLWYLWVLRHSSKVFAVSNDLCEHLKRYKINADHLPNVTGWTKNYKNRDMDSEVLRVVMTGRLCEQKDYSWAIRFCSLIKENGYTLQVSVYGEGPLRDDLLRQISEAELDKEFELLGYREDLEEVLESGNHDFLLLTSKYEGFGLVVLEAMCKGLVPIIRDCPFGPREIVGNGPGVILPYDFSREALLGAVDKIVSFRGVEKRKLNESIDLRLLTLADAQEKKWTHLR